MKMDIIKTTNIIRQKYNTLKNGEINNEIELANSLKPITKPLHELITKVDNSNLKNKTTSLINTKKLQKGGYNRKKIKFIKKIKFQPQKTFSGSSNNNDNNGDDVNNNNDDDDEDDGNEEDDGDADNKDDDDEDDVFESAEEGSPMKKPHLNDIVEASEVDQDQVNNIGALSSKYFNEIISNNHLIDSTYGVYYNDLKNEWKIGNSVLENNGDNIIINGNVYSGTPGLYELLFMKNPKSIYSNDDLLKYGQILKETNAYRRNYSANNQINGSRSLKYRNIIKKIVQQQKHIGRGLMANNNSNNIEYVYWDDPNELVERLKLLIASQSAGHSNHNNEIISIIEELREAEIIQ